MPIRIALDVYLDLIFCLGYRRHFPSSPLSPTIEVSMLEPAANLGRLNMAKAIERYFNVALYLLVLTGFGTLASTGGLDLTAVVVVGFALLVRGYQLLSRHEFVIPERWTTYLTLLYALFYFVDYLALSRSFLVATVHLVLFGMVILLFSPQRPRDHFMLAVLSFLMVLAAAVLTVDSVFLFSFAGFLLVGVITFILMEMRHSLAEDSGRAQDPKEPAPHRRMAHVLLATAPLLLLLILAGGFLIFFLIPRVSSRYLSAYAPSSDLSSGFTDRVALGRIGQIQQSSAVVMHVQIENDIQGAYDLKWRGVALSLFDGKVWSNPLGQTELKRSLNGTYRVGTTPGAAANPGVTGRIVHYRVLMEPIGSNVFFLAEWPETLTGNFRQISADSGGAVYNLDSDNPINRYEADSELTQPDAGELRRAANTVPSHMEGYLKLPPLDIRISKLAEEITASATNNYDKAVALELYLRTHYGYTLELPRSVPRDPLANFLFERKMGHCEYFASTMAVMLRSLRIPSRLLTGFRSGEFNDLTGQYVVRAANAHSWVEAYFPGYGWVSFDPTPAAALTPRSGWSRMALYVDAAASFWREWIINYDLAHQRTLGTDAAKASRRFLEGMRNWYSRNYEALLNSTRRIHAQITRSPARSLGGSSAIAACFLLLINLRRMLRALASRRLRAHPDRAPRESAALWYERMLRRLARRGWRKSPSQTPQDFVAAIQEPALRQKVATFTRAYESARFGRSVDDARVLPELFEEIATVER
jgi:protein-glutamine gamma-glutamyltransferase